jgi:hypothetical protein
MRTIAPTSMRRHKWRYGKRRSWLMGQCIADPNAHRHPELSELRPTTSLHAPAACRLLAPGIDPSEHRKEDG